MKPPRFTKSLFYRLKQVERHRTSELVRMMECFASPWYHDARRRFVYKVNADSPDLPEGGTLEIRFFDPLMMRPAYG